MIHLRVAERPEDITAIRVATGEADALIGGDLVVSAGAETLALMRTRAHRRGGRMRTRSSPATSPATRISVFPATRLAAGAGGAAAGPADAVRRDRLARALLGDTIYSNMMVLGAAWQRGLSPLERATRSQARSS